MLDYCCKDADGAEQRHALQGNVANKQGKLSQHRALALAPAIGLLCCPGIGDGYMREAQQSLHSTSYVFTMCRYSE